MLQIYQKPAAIRQDVHFDVCVQRQPDFSFARESNLAPVLFGEFEPACLQFPIVFTGETEATLPVALLGLRENENVFVDAAGQWAGGYIPGFFRRYPFVFSTDSDDTLTLCVDEGHTGVNRDGRGERLFDSEGNRTLYLQEVLKFATAYQENYRLTRVLCDRLRSLDLLEPATARISVPDGQSRALTGFSIISRQRLAALSDAEVSAMYRDGSMEACFLHLASLRNMDRLSAAFGTESVAPSLSDVADAEAAGAADMLNAE